uniref:30S ribosomal protein S3 n=1 Tax=Cyanidium caldarium TaxID=2771 RepID=A0A7H0WBB0_CYACA|nr:30S ribosomal protein S3 [Cyanidium caldarium]QNR39839.1 30S ribosomal protein S3 [Cyanidium caldarium]
MGHKTSPFAFRLGFLSLWPFEWCSNNYSEVSSKNILIFNYLKRILYENNIILGDFAVSFKFGKVFVNLTYYQLEIKNLSYKSKQVGLQSSFPLYYRKKKHYYQKGTIWEEIHSFLQYEYNITVDLKFYNRLNIFDHVNFISGYLRFKIESSFFSKIYLIQLCNEFNMLNNLIIYSGFYKSNCFVLQGLKILCFGRLIGLQNKISVVEHIASGPMPLQSKNQLILSSFETANTKHGLCGIKVYLYYKCLGE